MNDLKIGDKVEVLNCDEKWEDRTFIKPSVNNGVICVSKACEDDFLQGESFSTKKWSKEYWRKKQASKYIPFTHKDNEFLLGKKIRNKEDTMALITGLNYFGVYLGSYYINYYKLFNEWIFIDTDKPVGKEVKE